MKKFLTLRNIVLCSGALFLLVAFFISFAAKLSLTLEGEQGSFNGIVWGCKTFTIGGETMPISKADLQINGSIVPSGLLLAGAILMFVGAAGAVVVALLLKKPWAKWVVLGCAAVALTGAIFQFFALDSFVRALVDTLVKESTEPVSKEQYEQALVIYKQMIGGFAPKATVNVLMGVFGIVGSLAIGASRFIPEKELIK